MICIYYITLYTACMYHTEVSRTETRLSGSGACARSCAHKTPHRNEPLLLNVDCQTGADVHVHDRLAAKQITYAHTHTHSLHHI